MQYDVHQAAQDRYDHMIYRRCGKSGIKLPAISFGMWQNFGSVQTYENCRSLVLKAFDLGITHFDLANNYGPPPGAAEETFGRILKQDLKPYRDELLITSKAGYGMWKGPYGDHGSRKYLMASLDQSLKRIGVDYVDIFYHHRPDPETPLEETVGALYDIVRSGKALYVGVSNYSPEQTREASRIIKRMGGSLLIHQPRYNMHERGIENGLLDVLEEEEMGSVVFCPLAQGILTSRYLNGMPSDARVTHSVNGGISAGHVTPELIEKSRKLNEIALERGQSLAQMALAWVLRDCVTSAIIGASKVSQIEENVRAVDHLEFTAEELEKIEAILNS